MNYKRIIRILLRYIILPVSTLIILLIGVLLGWRFYAQETIRNQLAIQSENGIETLEAVKIGGLEQWIHIRGQDKQNPIILYVHGGPASPMMPVSHLFQPLWEPYFTIVQWDQRGAGKSYQGDEIAETINIKQMISDTLEMVDYLRNRFGQNKIVLMGHSWGSFLGIHAIKQKPEQFCAYIGVAQVVYFTEQIQHGFAETLNYARKMNEVEAIKDLETVGPPKSRKEMESYPLHIMQHWQSVFGFGWQHKTHNNLDLFEEAFKSPVYTLKEILFNVDAGRHLTLSQILAPYMRQDVSDLGYDFQIPVFFFSGRYDFTTTAPLVEKYVRNINAPYKEHVLFEESAHIPHIDEPELFTEALIQKVLPYCQ